ncbi:hypothetical protein [Sphaerochaeta sp. PS]|uniref:hypothetical protein n=1 Tax=Sphaerochaeta sp. PS TaxID=3076336 RepID=UPI0028A49664|nr:hypothetical protein [Sphaerochaeta sp. PS]MDT4762785.1 hypothetical protein [Sphaerochaeta sp. PS]
MSSIDRKHLVSRHNPCLLGWDPATPLSVGNGDFVFTPDCTGLQSFSETPPGTIPRCTMSTWAFHSYPDAPKDSHKLKMQEFQVGERSVGYMTDPTGQEALFNSLRVNPHRFNLGKIALISGSDPLQESSVHEAHQELKLYTGELESFFKLSRKPVSVRTVCHPQLDMVSLRMESPLFREGKLGLDISFPYASHLIDGSDWGAVDAHVSDITALQKNFFRIDRAMDATGYSVYLSFPKNRAIKIIHKKKHQWTFFGDSEVMEASILFVQDDSISTLPTFAATKTESAVHWQKFWTEGAAVSFWGSSDLRALELERRIILSEYLTAIQCLGSLPPQETGLTCNSWYGKFHLEMHPWHAAQAILWDRPSLVEQSLSWYRSILESAKERASQQGYEGARWPKMTDPKGEDSPSAIGPFLCWQQPHIIYFAELLYRQDPSPEILERYAELVFATAIFMADYAQWDEETSRFVLGPPLIPAQENHSPTDTLNPTFELEYWRWGLETAIAWKKRVKQEVPNQWKRVIDQLSPCPIDTRSNRYLAHERCSDTYDRSASDHPSLLFAYGFLPGHSIDVQTMGNSFDSVLVHWHFETMWGWDFPAMAMTLARLGRPHDAVDILLLDSPKNTYLPNGHNRQGSSQDLPLYLPGNGALLLAIAMMAGGWDGSDTQAPGFPKGHGWKVESEGLHSYI